MRKPLLFTAALSVSLFCPAALAQADEAPAPEAEQEEAAPPMEAGPEAGVELRREGANAQHTVEKGDTLWDLSQRFLGSPWYWPKVWSYNPEIANPHWIYPGNMVRFFQGGEDVPSRVEVGQPEAADVDEGTLVADEERVTVTGQIGYRVRPTVTLSLPGFATPAEVEGAGRIVGSFAETVMLSFPNQVYIRFNKDVPVKLGETYVVFRAGPELEHPVTGARVGFYTVILGEARINRIEKNGVAVAQITRQFADIQRSDLIGPSGESLLRRVAARPADRDVKDGRIVSGTTTYHAMLAEHSTLIVDRGADHGVKVGNVFHVFRQHDGEPSEVVLNPTLVDPEMPVEDVGQCVAVEVKSQATVCLVSRSLRELVRGDRAEIRAITNAPRAAR